MVKVCVAGGCGFIGSHVARRLLKQGHYVIVADWRDNCYFPIPSLCNRFEKVDLRDLKNCLRATEGCEWVFNFAADMGGMGFIQSNHSVILFNNTMISFNMLEAARQNCVEKFFYASSACVYPEHLQNSDQGVELKEEDAWPAQPQDAYGLEKLTSEELALHYAHDFSMQMRIARFHNVYGPFGTWHGGREKAPAALCRKVATVDVESNAIDSKTVDSMDNTVEIWGNGHQKRSFLYIDDAVEGILRLFQSDYTRPLNLGSDEMVSVNDLAEMIADVAKTQVLFTHFNGPEGVRGRSSCNDKIKDVLGWSPSITLRQGIEKLYPWIRTQVADAIENHTLLDHELRESQIVSQNVQAPIL